ncbi:MAG: polyhydroxyalkanoic acid system family protein [Deltaproteobacteria bacterium]|nr:polyhydroxyalkanoic acid system family protein [Deltaproteobacteria bacterium]
MSTVEVVEPHALPVDQAKAALGGFADDIKKYGMKLEWHGAKADLKGVGASGSVDVTSSAVKVVIKLGLVAKAAGVDAGKLEASIRKRLKAALTPTPPA